MKVIRAEALGICFGVRDALAVAQSVPQPETITIHGELVHNETVLAQLEARGFHMSSEEERSQLPRTAGVLVTAHGISDAERQRLELNGKQLIDTTCPLVRRVHRAAQSLAAEGFHVLLIGRPGHVEVQGIIDDLPSSDVIGCAEEIRTYRHARLGVISQTTTPPRVAEQVIEAIRACNPHAEIRVIDTICQPTRDRQEAVVQLLPQVDAMVVVGGRNSNNTRELVNVCRDRGVPTHHVQSAQDLVPDWFTGCRTVGLTAGTSTLNATINEVHSALAGM